MPATPPRSIPRRLFDLALPVIGINVLNVLSIFVDTLMCSRLPDAEHALSALGYSTQVSFLLMTAMMGLTVGTVALVARAHGAGEAERVDHILAQSTIITLALSAAVAVVGNLIAAPLLTALGASEAVLGLALDYLRPVMTGCVFTYLTLLYAAVLRGVGNTRLPFAIALVSNGANIFLNYGFILGNWGFPALGVGGAAWGTVGSFALTNVIYLLILTRERGLGVRMSLRPRPLDRPLIRETFRVGIPAALDVVIINVSFLAVLGMLGRIDQVAVGAHGVGLRVQALAFVPGLGVAMACAAMVGQALGAGRVEEARAVTRASVRLCVAILVVLGALFIAFAEPIVGLFDAVPGSRLHELAVEWIRILGIGMPIFGGHIGLAGVFQGAGATRTTLMINLVSTVLLQIPLGLILAFPLGLGVTGVWVSFPLGFILKLVLEIIAYRRGDWARVGLTI
ncbi:MAG: MATE family efflux transporter [Myxococcota bacterium]